ncbi:MAG TPA: hypothetical protein VGM39_21550 [Kofleriaceae bacterium]
MKRLAYVDGERIDLTSLPLLGQGGEAEVYDLGDGRVLKWWKPPQHPDYDGLTAAQAAATTRLAEAATKLRAIPGGLPASVCAPSMLAFAPSTSLRYVRGASPIGSDVVGYVMPKIAGTALANLGEPKWRRDNPVAGADVVGTLLALHDAIAGLHARGVVVGDFNDLNVLVEPELRRVHMIDVDSYQFGGFACPMFSERFVDPRLCDQQLVPVRAHDEASDWFAFAVMAFRSLLGVGPWGGVHQPADPTLRVAPTMRALRRVSVLANDIIYPRAARALAILPDELRELFRAIFERDQRGVFPRAELERLRLRPCTQCGDEHARLRCPTCAAVAQLPPAVVHGRLTLVPIAAGGVVFATTEVRGAKKGTVAFNAQVMQKRGPSPISVWLDGAALMRTTRLGAERIGGVLAGQTRAWIGESLGVGFYRAGGYAVGFVFRPDRGVLNDSVRLPKIRGQLVAARATIGTDRAWLWLTTVEQGRYATTCIVIGANASVIATETFADAPWVAGLDGACAVDPHLFVPTDDGIARIEVVQGTVALTRVFAETAPHVCSADRLALGSGGIDVVRARDAVRLQLS